MYKIELDVLCLDGYSEAFSGNGESAELMIESLIALILLDLFPIVVVDRVRVTCFPATPQRHAFCLLQAQVACPTGTIEVTADLLETLSARLENAIRCR